MTEGAPRRVLLIEDDDAIREIVGLALRDEGYEVLVAPDGAVALALIAQHPPDVILLDMKMPQTDGWAFAARYEQQAVATRAPIIVLTAAQDAAARAAEIGATDYLAKPFELEELLAMIAKFTG